VFVDFGFDEISSAVEACGLTGVQLDSEISGDLPAALGQRFGSALRILRVVHFSADPASELTAVAKSPVIDGVLIDSRTTGAVGGPGITYDWQAARASLFTPDRELKLVAAGGLRPENVSQAIALLRPWGVDVASGVEAAP